MKISVLAKGVLIILFVSLICGSARAQNTHCDLVNSRTRDSITYMYSSVEDGRLLISAQRQYGLHKGNGYDYIVFTVNVSTPSIEKDSLGLLKYMAPTLNIILEHKSMLKIDAGSDIRVNEYLKPQGCKDTEYRCGGLNPYPVQPSQVTESFRTILNEAELELLLRHKLKYVQLNEELIPVPEKMSNNFAKQMACIAKAKFYAPLPKGN